MSVIACGVDGKIAFASAEHAVGLIIVPRRGERGLTPADRNDQTDVLNGIACDAKGDRLFVTGKRWPKLFEIKLVKRTAP
jgi:Glutamine cyclotransferase